MDSRRGSTSDEEERLKGLINANLTKLEKIQEDGVPIITATNEWINDREIQPSNSEKLREFCKRGIEQAKCEEDICKTIIKDIDKLTARYSAIKDHQTPQTTMVDDGNSKRKRQREESVGSSKIKKHKNGSNLIKTGSLVAAKQPKNKDSEENWILATVVSYKPESRQYEVEDADRDESSNRPGERFVVPAKNVMAIPKPADIRSSQEFTPNTIVLALYPGTTCFYKAAVVLSPNRLSQSPQRTYLLTFEDDDNAQRHVNIQYVLEKPPDMK
ncbi:5427_t:CDS:2 [Funneliformis caledonium]|uniref:5427_t:CDS:1 n=2 Tax=Funneliformis TaxID=1117308 RepID=A0A9N8ZL88_9GLOM|nr:5427_t:CDS:2 [Funneliformis caledonium]CAG8512764.1 6116_t:CDS:2 [Funneliformis mosseae]